MSFIIGLIFLIILLIIDVIYKKKKIKTIVTKDEIGNYGINYKELKGHNNMKRVIKIIIIGIIIFTLILFLCIASFKDEDFIGLTIISECLFLFFYLIIASTVLRYAAYSENMLDNHKSILKDDTDYYFISNREKKIIISNPYFMMYCKRKGSSSSRRFRETSPRFKYYIIAKIKTNKYTDEDAKTFTEKYKMEYRKINEDMFEDLSKYNICECYICYGNINKDERVTEQANKERTKIENNDIQFVIKDDYLIIICPMYSESTIGKHSKLAWTIEEKTIDFLKKVANSL